MKVLQQGHELAQSLNVRAPGNWKYQIAESVILGKQVRFIADRGELNDAGKVALEALERFEDIDVEGLNEFEAWAERGLAKRLLGAVLARRGKVPGSD